MASLPEKRKRAEEAVICRDILRYGRDILQSDVFRKAEGETHHLHGSVSDHTLNVCIICVRLCHYLEKRNVRIRKQDLIRAALCHDLGMVDRKHRYKDRKSAWKNHPKESVKTAHTLIPDMDPFTEEMIRTHMWPVAGSLPHTKEDRLLNAADKLASMADWASWLAGKPYASRIKRKIGFQSKKSCGRK